MTVLTYGVFIEVEPGVTRPAIACTASDLARARALEAHREALRDKLADLVATAIHWDLVIPPRLRERVSKWRGGIADGEALLDELHDALFRPV